MTDRLASNLMETFCNSNSIYRIFFLPRLQIDEQEIRQIVVAAAATVVAAVAAKLASL